MTPERERQAALVIAAAKRLEDALDLGDRFTNVTSGRVVVVIRASDLHDFEQVMADWRKWCRENPNG